MYLQYWLSFNPRFDGRIARGKCLPGLVFTEAGTETINGGALHAERQFKRSAGILSLEFVELPLPREHPEWIAERCLQTCLHADTGRLGLEARVAGNTRLDCGKLNIGGEVCIGLENFDRHKY